VSPTSISDIINAGGKILKSEQSNGKFICQINGIRIYSDDEIRINNVTLPLSINADYDCDIELNICE
jgi:hypothetical protein